MPDNIDILKRRRQYQGRLDKVDNGCVRGWVWDVGDPAAVVFVELFVDGRRICTAIANEKRLDLERAEKRGGVCAYTIPIPRNYFDGRPHDLVVRTADGPDCFVVGSARVELRLSESAKALTDSTAKESVFYHGVDAESRAIPSARALIGRDDWLFLSDDTNRCRDQLLGRYEVGAQLLDSYVNAFMTRKAFFDGLGIPYLFVIAPTKELVYDDLLPPGFVVDESKLPVEVIKPIFSDTGVDYLCLRSRLREAKIRERVYYRTDTHWNDCGAYHAYAGIVEACQKYGYVIPPPVSRGSFEDMVVSGFRGDLSSKQKVVYVGGKREVVSCSERDFFASDFLEDSVSLGGSIFERVSTSEVGDHLKVSRTRESRVFVNRDASLPKVVVFHDSFMTAVARFLALNFSRAVFVWRPDVVAEVVRTEKPDLVLHVMVDRFLVRSPVGVT